MKSSLSRRDFLRISAAAAGSLAASSLPFRVLAQDRPDWITAGSAYSGQSVFGLAPTGEWGNVHTTMLAEFAEETGIDMTMDLTPGGDAYWAKVQAEILGRSGNTQFIAVDSLSFSRYADGGAFENLESYLANPDFPDYELDDYPDNILDLMARRNGQVFGIPIGGAAQIMFYRQDLLDAANVDVPTTWEEVHEAARALKTDDVWGAAWEMGGVFAAVRFGNALPADLRWLDEDTRLSALRDPRSINITSIWHQMYDEALIPPDAITNDLSASLTVFHNGRTALMPMSWPSLVSATEDPERSQVAGVTGYAQVPGGAPNASGWAYGIPVDASDELKEAAYLFVSWLTNVENSRRQITEFGNFDAGFRRSVLTDDVVAAISARPNGASELAGLEALIGSWPNARFNPNIPEWPSIINAVSPIIQQIVVGEIEAEAGMNAAADAGEAILAEAGYYD